MLNDVGILTDSVRFYHEPDEFTTANLYYAPHAGIYHCNHEYQVERTEKTCLDICLGLIIDKGIMTVQYRDQEEIAYPGMVVLLDCREPHRYFAASEELSFRWFHIVGLNSQNYVNEIIHRHGFVIPTSQNADIEQCCTQILAYACQDTPNVHLMSVHLHILLAQLASLTVEPEKSELELAIDDSAKYIEGHYADRDVSIPFLANRAAMSTCYYMRKFKEYHDTTPHQYLQAARLRAAKQQLTTTSRSIEDIGESCGYCNTSHFVMAFRKGTGFTPLQFRILWK